METQLPKSLAGRFEVLENLAETPFERCFRVHDRVLQRNVMLKLPGRGAIEGWSAPVCNRMLREARAVAKIRHEGICPIHWVEETEEGPVLVLDLPEGELLAERLQRGPLDAAETVDIAIQIAEALAQVHMQGVVHRAVGPSSVRVLANGRVRLGSFTFAKEFAEHGQPSSLASLRREAAPVVKCLPDYSAPEQLARQSADPRADVFALGCTMFRCLAGREAFEPGHEHEPMPDLRKLRRDVPKSLAEVVRKCTLHARTARYSTAQEVVDALKAVKAQSSSQGTGTGRLTVGIAAAICLAAVALFVTLRDGDATRSGDLLVVTPPVEPKAVYQPRYERVHGLFLGIGQAYAGKSFAELRNPTREVEAVTRALQDNDEQWRRKGAITPLCESEATYPRIDAELRRLETEPGENDAVLIYFAGHGESTGYDFALVAADVTGDIRNGTGFLRRSRLEEFVSRCPAKHVLVVLDCCYAGAVIPKLRGRPVGAAAEPRLGGAKYMEGWSREFLCSAGAEQRASDGAQLSPFCQALLDALRDERAKGSTHLATKFLGPEIGKRLDSLGIGQTMQEPALLTTGQQKGSFVFRLKPASAK